MTDITVVVEPQEIAVTVTPQTINVEVADPSKTGEAGATIVSVSATENNEIDMLMSDGRHIVVDNYTLPSSVVNTYTALSSVSAHRVVYYDGSAISYSDRTNEDSAYTTVGVTLTSGTTVNVAVYGEFSDNTFSFTPFLPVFVDTLGFMTQTAPTSGYLLQVGVALSATKILVEIQEPLFL